MKKLLILLLFIGTTITVISGPREDGYGNIIQPNPLPYSVTKAQVPLEGNNIRAFIWNTGVFDQDMRTNNTPGLEWTKNSGKFAIFTAGLSIGVLYQGSLRMANASYQGEYAPGYVDGGVFTTDSRFKIYTVKAGDNPSNNPDYANWGLMVPFGAPYVDINGNGSYDAGTDVPGIKDASQTVFVCLTDADPSNHTISEGFGGGTAPIFAEVRLTAWCYSSPGLEDLQFVQWVVINKAPVPWNATHFGIVVDPDLGDADDDYIGCDTTKDMAYCYNADNNDGNGTGRTYGANPPASGMDYFISPIVPTGNQNDSVVIYHPPGSNNKIVKRGFREIGLTSFVYFTNTGSPGPTCEQDPRNADEGYKYLKGIKKDGTPWVIPNTNPAQTTKFCYPGDPENLQGWTEFGGRIENCNGSTTGNQQQTNPPGDRRFIFNSGDESFVINPGDTQYIVLAQLVARGSSNVNSVTRLKTLDNVAQQVYNLNFKVIPPPPAPKVQTSYKPNSTLGTVDITFSWDDTSEYYLFDDQLFNSGFYKFQGYEIYEIKKDLTVFPDFADPFSDKSGLNLLAIYDYKDTIGYIRDSLRTGYTVNDTTQYTYVNVVPMVGFSVPGGFPNSGLSRHITVTGTKFQDINGGSDKFIYGNNYKFAIVAYGYNPTGLRGGKIIRNSLSTVAFTVTPEAPLIGTQYYYQNGDTLNTNRRDLALMPIVMNQEALLDAKYRIQFNSPDTTYNIMRSFDNGVTFSTLKSNLKFTSNRTADDSSRIYDGILFKFLKNRFTFSPPSNYVGNVGVIKDPTLSPDSIQTNKYGWDYNTSGTRNLTGSKFKLATSRPWQSVSMSLSYPVANTFTGLGSGYKADSLKNVKIVFTGYGNGQQAYRYLYTASNAFIYQDMREVPFKVYEIDVTDGTPQRQLNCAFVEYPDGSQDNKWEPTTDTLGGKDLLYIFGSDYGTNPFSYETRNLYTQSTLVDIMYVWSAMRISSGSPLFNNGDELIIYPYTVTRPNIAAGYPLYYEVDTKKPTVGSTVLATENNELSKIKVVPNPYYGYNNLESSTSGRFVTFRNLPKQVTIKIYSLNGDLIRKIEKNDNASTIRWGLNNHDDIPIASGIYIALIDAPGIGTRSVKIAVFTPEERIDF